MAENVGKKIQPFWYFFEVIDSRGREFWATEKAFNWLPEENQCGENLHPGFPPKKCTKIFEVAAESTGLKAIVRTLFESGYLDLGI